MYSSLGSLGDVAHDGHSFLIRSSPPPAPVPTSETPPLVGP